ncbi:hypothetical protein CAOG_06829 [Capsaspora owczarzaki ATCC 30864]|uniref:Thioredoxin domain-containing protein n=1 Tax=Capsaspora owczarzaki (strain ATCC 30864) TaxID=595528 RepID=A0A0D2X4R5_CAPO3|nr:hypothetical protein CAOG_06829 [Capsaspora owczarzaki ATCC 30864]KJE96519.1 hypothetical protein CAOG_006829 [Capsaspora owczarzaki ATCC 30864]|eukprot:XP_004344450.1 hypothetical protein CAOG_06829 [Capsaspora owczarzaki ATCC 30864]
MADQSAPPLVAASPRRFAFDWKPLISAYYAVNALIALFLVWGKWVPVPWMSGQVDQVLNWTHTDGTSRERYVTTLVCVAFLIQARRNPSIMAYLSSAMAAGKVYTLLALYLRLPSSMLCWAYSVVCIVSFVFLRQPEATLRAKSSKLDPKQLRQLFLIFGPDDYLLLELTIPWQTRSQALVPAIAEVIAQTPKHGKVAFAHLDVARYPAQATQLSVDNNANGVAIPALVLFKGNKEIQRSTSVPVHLGTAALSRWILSEFKLNEINSSS